MPDASLTGSENDRFNQIHSNWLVFEPISNSEKSVKYGLFSVPLGQNKSPQIIIESGSVSSLNSEILIEKEIHCFDDETEAVKFVNNLSPENIAAYKEIEKIDIVGVTKKFIEVHVINYPNIDFNFSISDFADIENGFMLETFFSGVSGSQADIVDFQPVTKKIVFDKTNCKVVSDTYLRFFCLESDFDQFSRQDESEELMTAESFSENINSIETETEGIDEVDF